MPRAGAAGADTVMSRDVRLRLQTPRAAGQEAAQISARATGALQSGTGAACRALPLITSDVQVKEPVAAPADAGVATVNELMLMPLHQQRLHDIVRLEELCT